MRKGILLVELMVVLAVFASVSLVLGILFRTALTDVPRAQRLLDTNTIIANVLGRMRQDVDAASSLPRAFGKTAAGDKLLLIELPEGVVCYQLEDDKVTRHRLGPDGALPGLGQVGWSAPGARIRWRTWREAGKGYAVELRTSVSHSVRGKVLMKLANSHVFFLGALPGVRKKT